MARVERFEYRLAGMRKPDSFVVYRRLDDGSYLVQGNGTIARVRRGEARGIINWRGSNGKYFVHLHPRLGAELFDVPREFMGLVMEFAPSSGDLIGASPETGPVYVA